MTDTPKDAVTALWAALARRDWDAVADHVTDDCIYYDVPIGPGAAACGPKGIVARLKMGLESLATYTNFDGRMIAEGDIVMYEHSERWEWATGENVLLPFVSVHRVSAGKVSLWADYWDYATLLNAAPAAWQESLATGDMAWIYDATGQV